MQNSSDNKPIITWLFAGCFLIFCMVILGGITRLTGSGLSITEWDVIMGAVPPLNQTDWNIAFDKYKQSPQYQKINEGMDLAQFKSIFFWEYFHRLVGRLIGVVFIIPFLYFLFRKMLDPPLIRKLIVILLLGALQGFLGWYMVASGLVNRPSVSHYRLALHLITAFITFGYTLWVALDLIYKPRVVDFSKVNDSDISHLPGLYLTDRNSTSPAFKKLSVTIAILVVVQIIYGAFMANLGGGKIYNTFPKMGDEWFPSSFHPVAASFFDYPIGVQIVHRYIGSLLVILGFILIYFYRKNPVPALFAPVLFFILALVVQFTLGVTTLLYAAPIILAALHQVGGFVLFASVVILLNRNQGRGVRGHSPTNS